MTHQMRDLCTVISTIGDATICRPDAASGHAVCDIMHQGRSDRASVALPVTQVVAGEPSPMTEE